jgi:hypothetical protein
MGATLWLLGCLLGPAQAPERPAPAARAERLAGPRLAAGQEFVYRGTYTEEASGGGVQFGRACRVEVRLLVLETNPRGAEVAFFTCLRPRDSRPAGTGDGADAASARLEVAHVDAQGRVTPAPGVSLAAPLEGPPAVECGAFVEVPPGRAQETGWQEAEAGRPARAWHVAGTDTVAGAAYVKLAATQQSDDWDRPRADRAGWRRADTVWFAPRLGVAFRVERVIERRDPSRQASSLRGTLRYELESSLQYPAEMVKDRRQDVLQARAFAEAAAPLLPAGARAAPQMNALLAKINYHLDHQPPTPYRDAVLQVKRHVEAARRGEVPVAPPEDAATPLGVAAAGRPAPDFLATDFTGPSASGPRRWRGRPALLVFYSPGSPTAGEVLRFAQHVQDSFGPAVAVVGLTVSPDRERALRQRADLGATFPVLDGSGLRISYAVESTPKLFVTDESGVVRGAYVGWGPESDAEVLRELRQWVKKP